MKRFTESSLHVVVAASAAVLLIGPSTAWAIDTIISPNVEKGGLALEYLGNRTFDDAHDQDNIQGHEIALVYAPVERWGIELAGTFSKEPDQDFTWEGVEWKNIFQFFESKENWVDSGMSVTYAASTQSQEPDAIGVKLLLEKEWGAFTHIANIGVAHEIGKNSSGGIGRSFAWSSRYHYSELFEPGFEIQSDFGKASEHLSFHEQGHHIGPALYGNISERIGYEAAFLFGVTGASSASAARVLLHYQLQL